MQLACEMQITKVAVKAKQVGPQVLRTMTIALTREFDALLAKAIGGEAPKMLDSVRKGGVEKVVMPIDALVASLKLNAQVSDGAQMRDDTVEIGRAFGKKAVATASKVEDLEPNIALEFTFLFDQAAWAWFGRQVGGSATVEIEPSQLQLMGTKKAS